MFGFIKKIFIRLFTIRVNVFNHTKCVSLNNPQCITQHTLINLRLKEYSQGLRCYLFAVNLDGCMGSGNTLNDLSNKLCVLHKTEFLNLRVCNMLTGKN